MKTAAIADGVTGAPTKDSLLLRLRRLWQEPHRLRGALLTRIAALPFRAGLTSIWPGTYLSCVPDRYVKNYYKYLPRHGFLKSRDSRMFYRKHWQQRGDLSRFYFLNLVCEQILKEGITGDIAELGVFRGNSAATLNKLAQALGTTAYLLDTFQGFDSRDVQGPDAGVTMTFSQTSLQLAQSIAGAENAEYIVGRFPESASQLPSNAVYCLVHIDCDLYAPCKAALEYFYPRMRPGGFLVLHDYTALYWDGIEMAIDEFFSNKPERVIPIPDRFGTAVIRKCFAGDSPFPEAHQRSVLPTSAHPPS
jgi:hypothetical protein